MQHKEKQNRRDRPLQEQINNIKTETDNPAIINDVVDTSLEAYPGHIEEVDDNEPLDDLEEDIVENFVEGKTWNTDRE